MGVQSMRVTVVKDPEAAKLRRDRKALLAACKALLAEVAFEQREAHGEVCEADPCCVCMAKAAIAKAEGK